MGPARTVCSWYLNPWLTGVTDVGAGSCPGGTSLASLSYHANGMVNVVSHGNGVLYNSEKDPNDMGRPYRIVSSNALANWTSGIFEYDGAGNVKALRGMSEPVARPAATHQDYTYDAFANLIRITLNDTTYQDLPTSPSSNRLTASGYDPSGNMTTWGGYTYTYDPLSAMTTLVGGALNKAYRYDAGGERLSFKDVPSNTTVVTLRGLDGKVLREYAFNGRTWTWGKDLVYRNGQLLAAIDSGGTRHFTLDHLGSPRLITDASRSVAEYHAYWGYGQEIDTACGVERMKFTGHERDNQCSAGMLDYMHARYYNPTIGRFLAVDQGNGKSEAPQSWNRYAYARGNPITLLDPDGRAVIAVNPAVLQLNASLRDTVASGLNSVPWVGHQVAAGADVLLSGLFPRTNQEFASAMSSTLVSLAAPVAVPIGSSSRDLVDAVTRGPLLKWNEFQSLLAGQGYSTQAKAAIFKIYQSTGLRPLAVQEVKALAKVASSEAEAAAIFRQQYELQKAASQATDRLDVLDFLSRLWRWYQKTDTK